MCNVQIWLSVPYHWLKPKGELLPLYLGRLLSLIRTKTDKENKSPNLGPLVVPNFLQHSALFPFSPSQGGPWWVPAWIHPLGSQWVRTVGEYSVSVSWRRVYLPQHRSLNNITIFSSDSTWDSHESHISGSSLFSSPVLLKIACNWRVSLFC